MLGAFSAFTDFHLQVYHSFEMPKNFQAEHKDTAPHVGLILHVGSALAKCLSSYLFGGIALLFDISFSKAETRSDRCHSVLLPMAQSAVSCTEAGSSHTAKEHLPRKH